MYPVICMGWEQHGWGVCVCVCVICTITLASEETEKRERKKHVRMRLSSTRWADSEREKICNMYYCNDVLCRYRGGPGFTITLLSGGAVMITYHSACVFFLTDDEGGGEGGERTRFRNVRQDQSTVIAYPRRWGIGEEGRGFLRSESIVQLLCLRFFPPVFKP